MRFREGNRGREERDIEGGYFLCEVCVCACESLIFLYFRSWAAYFKVSQFLCERSKVSRRKTSAVLTLVHVDIPYIPYMHTCIHSLPTVAAVGVYIRNYMKHLSN